MTFKIELGVTKRSVTGQQFKKKIQMETRHADETEKGNSATTTRDKNEEVVSNKRWKLPSTWTNERVQNNN
jgi:hypothetical protein